VCSALLLAGLIVTGCSGDTVSSAYLQANRERLEQPASATERKVRFVIAPGATARTVAENLHNQGLISDSRLFEAYVRTQGLATRLEAGAYELSPTMTIPEVAETLQRALAPDWAVRIGEGWRLEQTAAHLTTNTRIVGDAYRLRASDGDLTGLDATPYEFLGSRPAGASLEGFLYPDTYRLELEGATELDLLRRQLDRFGEKVMPLWRQAEAQGSNPLGLYETLILASIIEREAVVDEERPIIAGVYLNRLKIGMKLQADPTVQYAMGYQLDTGQWWKTPVYLEEYKKVDSPYNTYLHTGLPPGPIASPSARSVEAALAPARHSFLYFVALPDGSGKHAFARTYEEHVENVMRYREGS
jgi:UPF0755 protein